MQFSTGTTIVFFCLVTFLGIVRAQDDPYRLPPNYIINHCDITLTVPHEAFTANSSNYSGSVKISFQVTVKTNEVKLHSSYQYIEIIEIRLNQITVLPTTSYSANSTTDILTLNFDKDFLVGENNTLEIDFNARLLGGGGFYKVSYRDHNNEVQYLATTQFEATNARYAFPCFDEPTYKSTFAYTLTYPSNMNAFTNTPEISSTTDSTTSLTTSVFGTSPQMPAYLVAFTISKYTYTEGALEDSSEYKHRLISRMDKEDVRSWAMKVTPKVIEHLNSYTGFNYTRSISKLDQVAVPGKSGAMENWGLVIYGESSLLFDNTLQTNANKQSVAALIAHELAHMWFGNLVTCKWWSEIFLNEGFATLFQHYTTAYVLPSFEMEKQFVIRILQPILITEGNLNVPALRSNASTPSEISAKFNSYSYNKGASVLRMIEHIVGRDYFKLGIQKYLSDNAYQPVEPQNLWDAIQTVTENAITTLPINVSLSEVVDNWINKGGYPVITVSLNQATVRFSQQRFLYSGTDNTRWYVPISYSTAATADNNENTSPKGWVTPTEDFELTNFSNSSAWIVVNNQQTGFYRVNYDNILWENLARALKESNFSGIHETNRAQIIEDSYMLARAGYLTFGQVLRNVEFLANDTSYISWYPAVNLFWYILQKSGSTTSLGLTVTNHFLDLLASATEANPLTPIDEDNHLETVTKVLVNSYSCKFGNSACTSYAKQLFATYKTTYQRPNINVRSIVYCNAIRYSDNPIEDWNFLYEQYQNSSVSSDSSTIWSALGCSTNTTVLNGFLSKILNDDSVITSSLYNSVFSTIYSANEIGVDTALEYLINNFENIAALYNSISGLTLNNCITGLGAVFTKTSQIEQLENFLNKTTSLSTSIRSAINSALSTARSNQAIITTHTESLLKYFGLSNEDTTISTTNTSTSTTSTSTSTTSTSTTTTSTTTQASTTEGGSGGASTSGTIGFVSLVAISLATVKYGCF